MTYEELINKDDWYIRFPDWGDDDDVILAKIRAKLKSNGNRHYFKVLTDLDKSLNTSVKDLVKALRNAGFPHENLVVGHLAGLCWQVVETADGLRVIEGEQHSSIAVCGGEGIALEVFFLLLETILRVGRIVETGSVEADGAPGIEDAHPQCLGHHGCEAQQTLIANGRGLFLGPNGQPCVARLVFDDKGSYALSEGNILLQL